MSEGGEFRIPPPRAPTAPCAVLAATFLLPAATFVVCATLLRLVGSAAGLELAFYISLWLGIAMTPAGVWFLILAAGGRRTRNCAEAP